MGGGLLANSSGAQALRPRIGSLAQVNAEPSGFPLTLAGKQPASLPN